MAKTYLDIQNSAYTVGNIMDWTNALTRLSGVPVDITEVYDSYAKAVEYAAVNPVAYEGQLITVTENGDTTVYVITPAVQGTYVVGEGDDAVEYDVNIKKVGIVPTGDNASITVTEAGLISLFGFSGAENGMLPVREDGKLVWKTLEAIGAGDGNDNTTYEFELTDAKTGIIVTPLFNGQPIMEGEEGAQVQKKFELVLDVYTKAEADEKFLAKADYVPYDDKDLKARVKAIEDDYLTEKDKYDDSDLQTRVKALEDEERYDDTDLANRVTVNEEAIANIEEAIGDAESGLTKAIADEKVRAEAAEADLLAKINAIDYIDADELATELAPYAKTTDVETALADKADKEDFEELKGTVDAFLTGDGTEAALDSLKELIEYIKTHDDVEISDILSDIQAIENKLVGIDGTVAAYVTAAIDALKIGDYAKAADLTALVERVEALEGKPFDSYATKTEVQNVDAKFAGYTTTSDLTDLLAEKADANAVVSNETFTEFQTTNAEAISAARTGAVSDVEAKGYAVATEVANTYATKQSVTDLGNTINATLNDYLTEETAEATYEKIGTAYTKAEIDTKIGTPGKPDITDENGEVITAGVAGTGIFANAYSRAEIDKLLDEVQGGSSASADSVLRQLNTYKSTNDERVTAIETANSAQDTAIAAAQAQADKGVADAKTANDAIAALTTGAIANNTSDIVTIKGRLDTLETAKGNHEQRITAAESKITALESADELINGSIGTINGNITTLQNKDSELAGLITALQTDKADASSVYTKTETDKQISDAIAAIPAVDLKPYLRSEDAAATYATITDLENIYKAGEGEATATGILAEEIARAKAAEQKIADDLALLIENPTEALDSVKELITHVQANGTAVEGIITRLGGHDTDIQKNASDIVAINEAIAAIVQPKESAEISVATDGTLGVKEVNVNKLVQTAGDTLILNGGDAGSTATAQE